MIQGVQKNLEYEQYEKFHTLACLDLSVWLASPCGPVFDLATYVMQVCPLSYLPKTPLKAFSGRLWKEGNIQMPLVRYHTHWVIEWIIWGTCIYFTKFIKPPHRWSIKEWMISDSVITVLSCNHLRTWKSYTPHRDQGKGWIKCQLI
jgi:hypothetical protein